MACRLLCERATFGSGSVAERELRADMASIRHGLAWQFPVSSPRSASALPNVRRGDLRARQPAVTG